MNTECSTLRAPRVSISQRGHIHSRSLGGSTVQLMHKEAARPEETLCGQEKRLGGGQLCVDVLGLIGLPLFPVNVINGWKLYNLYV